MNPNEYKRNPNDATVVVVGKLAERSCYLGKTVSLDVWQGGRYLKTDDQVCNSHDGFSLPGVLLIKRFLTTILQSEQTLSGNLDHLLHVCCPHTHTSPAWTRGGLGFIANAAISKPWRSVAVDTSALLGQQGLHSCP